MIDRLDFDVSRLENGITTYFRPLDTGYTTLYLQVPVGSSHNMGTINPGTFHFLEHILVERSQVLPALNEFKRLAGLLGGWSNASTWPLRTTYQVSVPSQHLHKVIPALVGIITKPLMLEEDIETQRGVIDNERRRMKWWPGNNELQHYLKTQWMYDTKCSLNQIFGDIGDLERMSITSLTEAHSKYLDPRVLLLGYGSGDITLIKDLLSEIAVKEHDLPNCYTPASWIKKDYHEHPFRDISRYELKYGAVITPRPDLHTVRQLDFILEYVTNSVHGTLHTWLREELGWIYSLGFSSNVTHASYVWSMNLPLTTHDQVATVREQIWGHIKQALRDTDAVNREVNRLIGKSVYWYHRPDSITQQGLGELECYGQIVSVTESIQILEMCRDTSLLQQIYDTYFTDEYVGSMCATPLK